MTGGARVGRGCSPTRIPLQVPRPWAVMRETLLRLGIAPITAGPLLLADAHGGAPPLEPLPHGSDLDGAPPLEPPPVAERLADAHGGAHGVASPLEPLLLVGAHGDVSPLEPLLLVGALGGAPPVAERRHKDLPRLLPLCPRGDNLVHEFTAPSGLLDLNLAARPVAPSVHVHIKLGTGNGLFWVLPSGTFVKVCHGAGLEAAPTRGVTPPPRSHCTSRSSSRSSWGCRATPWTSPSAAGATTAPAASSRRSARRSSRSPPCSKSVAACSP